MESVGTISIGKALPTSTAEVQSDLEFLVEFLEKSDAARRVPLQNAREMLDNYMVVPYQAGFKQPSGYGGPNWPGMVPNYNNIRRRSVLKDPETHQIVEALCAQAMGLMFGDKNYLVATPRGKDDYEKARMLSRLIMAVLDGPGVFRTLYQAWKDAFIFGTAVLEFSWESKQRQAVRPTVILDENGQPVVVNVPQPYVTEGPVINQVDIWDCYPDPSGTRIQTNMLGFAKRFRMTRQNAEARAAAGIYSEAAVREAVAGFQSQVSGSQDKRFPMQVDQPPTQLQMMTGFEYRGFVPGKHADRASGRVLTTLNGTMVRDTMNPHLDGVIPFKEIVVNPIQGRFWGLAPAEVNRYLQDSADQMLMLLSDAADDMVNPQTLVSYAFGGNPDELLYNKRVVMCNNPEGVKDRERDYSALQMAAAELMRRKNMMRESSGATNTMQSIPVGDRATATEVSELVRLASQRSELMVTLSERDDFPFIGKMIHSLLRQFAPNEGVIASLNGEPLDIPYEAIDIDADIRFVGSRRAQSKFQKVAAYKEAIATTAQALQLIPIMPDMFVRYYRDGLEIDDAEQILQGAVQFLQMQQQQMAMQEAASAPGSFPKSKQGSMATETGATEREGRRVA